MHWTWGFESRIQDCCATPFWSKLGQYTTKDFNLIWPRGNMAGLNKVLITCYCPSSLPHCLSWAGREWDQFMLDSRLLFSSFPFHGGFSTKNSSWNYSTKRPFMNSIHKKDLMWTKPTNAQNLHGLNPQSPTFHGTMQQRVYSRKPPKKVKNEECRSEWLTSMRACGIMKE